MHRLDQLTSRIINGGQQINLRSSKESMREDESLAWTHTSSRGFRFDKKNDRGIAIQFSRTKQYFQSIGNIVEINVKLNNVEYILK